MADPRSLALDESRDSSALAVRSAAPVIGPPTESVGDMVPVDAATQHRLAESAGSVLDDLLAAPLHGPERRTRVARLALLGDGPMQEVGDSVGRMLQRRAADPSGGGADAVARTGATLTELQQIAVGRDLRRHHAGPAVDLAQLDALTTALLGGQDELRLDNAALRTERDALWQALGRLTEAAVLAHHVADGLEERVAALRDQRRDAAAATLESDALPAVRRRHQELTTQLAVGVQGYLALDVVRRTNVELVESVDRALDTVAALRVAAMADLGRS